ncbi:histidine phosphatase family protein [Nocardioides sp.]|uniref:SixA phosphatase family protein n=1 Tax=Nocardioides sp. TaxID=35761 RepID=UPI002735CB37|nr:histidine phosphatase family protein [Nocardioides sp.]MDP3892188.1 histidine phosphatase family protein [Nocardioides sp.]
MHPGTRRLLIVRHAKAEPYAATDRERRLTDRGRDDAAAAGRWLASRELRPGQALVSGAVRTVETWHAVAEAAAWHDLEPRFEDGLYAAGPDAVLDEIRLVPDEVSDLMVIGHNPTMATLAQLLDDGDGDPAVVDEMVLGFPTCALALFSVAGDWRSLDYAGARVEAYHVGRG